MRLSLTYLFVLLFLGNLKSFSTEYHVAKTGKDQNPGTFEAPFKSISAAAKVAIAGDVITVHEGIYRERINPVNGGTSNINRIVYRAARGENVIIKGSEIIKGWEKLKNGVWKVKLDNTFFCDYNPYKEIIGGDWFLDNGRVHHTGEVYMNGKSFYEVDSLDKVIAPEPLQSALDQEGSMYQWYCESDAETTIIWANFHNADPNKELVEINVRPTVFFPELTHINYITVTGFTMSQAATQWAPPTAEQIGLIGPHWSKGWIIENNIITDSKCSGISLGKERSTGQNRWTNEKVKHGTQREREVIFNALQLDWSKENIGSHIVKNNVIYNCEQTGICGHLGAVFSYICNNHIYNIHVKRQFSGWEMAGIKLHAAIDVLLENNLIHDCWKGLWLDWQAQGARVTRNVMFRNEQQDLFIEVSHGPHIVDNNILLSKQAFLNASTGTAFAYNLVAGEVKLRTVLNRFTPYHFPHSTQIAGVMTIQGGDDRFYNNIFINQPDRDTLVTGTWSYFDYPLPTDDWTADFSYRDYDPHKYPVYIASNLYLNGAKPYFKETDLTVDSLLNPDIRLQESKGEIYLHFRMNESAAQVKTQMINTKILGEAFQPETPFENRDGSELEIETDFWGLKRDQERPRPGPFENIKQGENMLKIR